MIIIGGGPAGLSAGIYAARSRLKTIIFEQSILGGQMATTDEIENYPGTIDIISGQELAKKMIRQAKRLGVEIKQTIISEINLENKTLTTKENSYKAKKIIIATGARPRQLNIPGEREFLRKGVSYCALCDGAFFKDKEICVIGGGDSAIEEAIYLTRYAKKVYIIHRKDSLRAALISQEKALANSKIEILFSHIPIKIQGTHSVEQIILENTKTKEKITKPIQGVFIYIGQIPNTDFINNQLKLDDTGFIITNEKMETSKEGIYAAGDVRQTNLRQVITAAADGAIAASEIVKKLQ